MNGVRHAPTSGGMALQAMKSTLQVPHDEGRLVRLPEIVEEIVEDIEFLLCLHPLSIHLLTQ